MRRFPIYAVLFLILPAAWPASHRALLPRVQRIQYGAGRFTLDRAAVSVASGAGTEEQFAAAELGRWLGVPVHPGARGKIIRMALTGSLPALPEADEKPGPEGRESYRIAVTPDAVTITAPSAAGLYYGAQTLRQMVEDGALPEAQIHDWPHMAYRGFMMDLSHG